MTNPSAPTAEIPFGHPMIGHQVALNDGPIRRKRAIGTVVATLGELGNGDHKVTVISENERGATTRQHIAASRLVIVDPQATPSQRTSAVASMLQAQAAWEARKRREGR